MPSYWVGIALADEKTTFCDVHHIASSTVALSRQGSGRPPNVRAVRHQRRAPAARPDRRPRPEKLHHNRMAISRATRHLFQNQIEPILCREIPWLV
jgi:hypothetical protein